MVPNHQMLLTPVIPPKSTLPTDDELALHQIRNAGKFESRGSHSSPSSQAIGPHLETKTFPNVSYAVKNSLPSLSTTGTVGINGTVLSSWLQGNPMKKISSSGFGTGTSEACVLPSVAELQKSLRSNAGLNILGLLNSNTSKFQLLTPNTHGTLLDYPVPLKVPVQNQTSSIGENIAQLPKASSTPVITSLPVAKVKLPFIAPKQPKENSNSQPSIFNPISKSTEKLSQYLPSVEKFIHVTENTSVNVTTSQTSDSNLPHTNFIGGTNCHNDLRSVVLPSSVTKSPSPCKDAGVQNWSDAANLSASLSENFNKQWVGENQVLNQCHNVDMLSVLSSACTLPEFPENIFAQCVEEIHCYKCKFCSVVYISLSKDDAISHLTSTHSKELEILQGEPICNVDSTTTKWLSSNQLLAPNFRTFGLTEESNNSNLLSTCTEIDVSPSIAHTDSTVVPQEASFICGKCQKTFFCLQECQEHLSVVHNVKSSRIRECKQHLEIGSQQKTTEKAVSLLSKTNGKNLKKDTVISAKSPGSGLPNTCKKKGPKLKIISRTRMKRELGCYICEFKGCNVRFQLLENLEYHYKCHVNGSSMFACPECSTTLAQRWSSMAGHLWRQHVVDLELHACDQCSFRTYNLSLLENKHKCIHGEERPYLCDTCGKSFKNSNQLRSHKVMHRGRPIGECHLCHKRFQDKRMLRLHLEMVHKKMKPYLCNYCGYSASSRSTLRMHMRQHTGEKPYPCDLCDYCTSDHNSLRRHKMRHSGERPYKCPYCKYACIQSSTYKSHLKRKHPGQNKGLMFSCSICCFNTIKEDIYMTHIADHKLSAARANLVPSPEEQIDEQYLSLPEAVHLSLSQTLTTSGCNTANDHALLSALEDDAFQNVDDRIS